MTTGSHDGAAAEPSATAREPRGYTPLYGMASFGLYMAILTPVLGGLSLKIQTLTDGNLERAAAQLSLVTGIGALFALVAQPLVGRLSDRTTSRWRRSRMTSRSSRYPPSSAWCSVSCSH